MSSNNIKGEINFINNNRNNLKKNKRDNRFSFSKPSFLKKSTFIQNYKSNNDGYHTYREKSFTKKKTTKNVSLSIDRKKNIKLSKLFTNTKNNEIKKKTTATTFFNKFKRLNNKLLNQRFDISLNTFKKDLSLNNYISLRNTNNSFFKNISKSKSKNKEVSKNDFKTIDDNAKNKYLTKKLHKNANNKNTIILKNRANIINKKYIYVKNKPHNNQNIKVNFNNKNNNSNFNGINSERLNQRFKKMNLNNKNLTERIIISKNQSKNAFNYCKKKFTFNDLKSHNKELIKMKNINNNLKEIQKQISFNEKKRDYKIQKNNLSNLLKKNILDNNKTDTKNNINNGLNFLNKNRKTNNQKINKTQDDFNNKNNSSANIIINKRKHNSLKRRIPLNMNEIISRILTNNINLETKIDINNSFLNSASNFLYSKKEAFNTEKTNKKISGYCNLLILDNKEKRELYLKSRMHKSFNERSKLLDYINLKVINYKKVKDNVIKKENKNKKENIFNINNKSNKKVNMSRNIKNSSILTNSNSITLENNNTNYISPKQFEKEEQKMLYSNTPLIYNRIISMTMSNSLKITVNNSNKNIIKKKNNNNKIDKPNNQILRKKLIHNKNSSISNVTSIKNNVMTEKNNFLKITPKQALTPIKKETPFIKQIKLKKRRIIKKVLKIDSCSVAGFSSPGISKINQDNYFILKEFMNNSEQFFMGICDGHGSYGHIISKYICNILPKKLMNAKEEDIIQTFLTINQSLIEESKIDCSLSGSTCCSLIITPNKIISINLGDSRAVLARYENGQYNAINLTRDHKPTELDEMKRVLNCGGRIKQFTDSKTGKNIGPERIWLKNSEIPGLAMTRSIGDNLAHMVGVTPEPEIQIFDFIGNEKFILLASDGIWQFIDSDESVRIIKDFYEKDNDAVGALNSIVKEAFKRWKNEEDNIDDITTILIFFE